MLEQVSGLRSFLWLNRIIPLSVPPKSLYHILFIHLSLDGCLFPPFGYCE